MLSLVDSHCHLDRIDLTPYGGDLSKALLAAKEKNVEAFLCVAVDMETFNDVLKIAERFPQVYASIGLHPTEKTLDEPSVEILVEKGSAEKVVAIGETGLDFYRLEGAPDLQIQRFRDHIRAAKILKKPLIIHTRQAREATIQILKEENAQEVGGVMHCFTEDWAMAEQAMALGFYISFSGIVTFKNAKELQEIAKKISLDSMLVETDAPYLAPMPYRGKSNEPAWVYYVAEYIAALRGESLELIAEKTTRNFYTLFKI